MSNWLNLWIEVYDFSTNVSNNNYNPVNRMYYASKIMTKLYYLLATNNNHDTLDSLIDYLALQNINDTIFIYGLKDILIEIFKVLKSYNVPLTIEKLYAPYYADDFTNIDKSLIRPIILDIISEIYDIKDIIQDKFKDIPAQFWRKSFFSLNIYDDNVMYLMDFKYKSNILNPNKNYIIDNRFQKNSETKTFVKHNITIYKSLSTTQDNFYEFIYYICSLDDYDFFTIEDILNKKSILFKNHNVKFTDAEFNLLLEPPTNFNTITNFTDKVIYTEKLSVLRGLLIDSLYKNILPIMLFDTLRIENLLRSYPQNYLLSLSFGHFLPHHINFREVIDIKFEYAILLSIRYYSDYLREKYIGDNYFVGFWQDLHLGWNSINNFTYNGHCAIEKHYWAIRYLLKNGFSVDEGLKVYISLLSKNDITEQLIINIIDILMTYGANAKIDYVLLPNVSDNLAIKDNIDILRDLTQRDENYQKKALIFDTIMKYYNINKFNIKQIKPILNNLGNNLGSKLYLGHDIDNLIFSYYDERHLIELLIDWNKIEAQPLYINGRINEIFLNANINIKQGRYMIFKYHSKYLLENYYNITDNIN